MVENTSFYWTAKGEQKGEQTEAEDLRCKASLLFLNRYMTY